MRKIRPIFKNVIFVPFIDRERVLVCVCDVCKKRASRSVYYIDGNTFRGYMGVHKRVMQEGEEV